MGLSIGDDKACIVLSEEKLVMVDWDNGRVCVGGGVVTCSESGLDLLGSMF